jgi:GT2 family glycosyltransferase
MGPFAELRQKVLTRAASRDRIEDMTSREQEVDWVSGACLLVRRSDADAAGLLDERYFMYCEDVDFCAAIRRRGGRVYFTPATEVVHLGGRSGRVDRARHPGCLPPKPPGVLRKTPPGMGAPAAAISGAPRQVTPQNAR